MKKMKKYQTGGGQAWKNYPINQPDIYMPNIRGRMNNNYYMPQMQMGGQPDNEAQETQQGTQQGQQGAGQAQQLAQQFLQAFQQLPPQAQQMVMQALQGGQ